MNISNNEQGFNVILMPFQYGAIDTNIIDKLRNEGDLRMRLQVYRPYQILFIHSSIFIDSSFLHFNIFI